MTFPYRFFSIPFAVAGTLTAVPNPSQSDGSVSYNDGYGPDYALDPATNPSALNIERAKFNQIMNDVTTFLQYLQDGQVPAWIDATTNGGTAFSYTKNAQVLYTDGQIWQSLVASNTATPGTDATKWQIAGATGGQRQTGNFATDTGSSTAYAINPQPIITANVDGATFRWQAVHQNTTKTPSFATGTAPAKTIVRSDGTSIDIGDISLNGIVETMYGAALDKHVLLATNLPPFTQVVAGGSGNLRWPGTRFVLAWIPYSITLTTATSVSGMYFGNSTSVPLGFTFSGAPLVFAMPGTDINGQVATIQGFGNSTNTAALYAASNTTGTIATGMIFSLGLAP